MHDISLSSGGTIFGANRSDSLIYLGASQSTQKSMAAVLPTDIVRKVTGKSVISYDVIVIDYTYIPVSQESDHRSFQK
jgi:hypothetical protein